MDEWKNVSHQKMKCQTIVQLGQMKSAKKIGSKAIFWSGFGVNASVYRHASIERLVEKKCNWKLNWNQTFVIIISQVYGYYFIMRYLAWPALPVQIFWAMICLIDLGPFFSAIFPFCWAARCVGCFLRDNSCWLCVCVSVWWPVFCCLCVICVFELRTWLSLLPMLVNGGLVPKLEKQLLWTINENQRIIIIIKLTSWCQHFCFLFSTHTGHTHTYARLRSLFALSALSPNRFFF